MDRSLSSSTSTVAKILICDNKPFHIQPEKLHHVTANSICKKQRKQNTTRRQQQDKNAHRNRHSNKMRIEPINDDDHRPTSAQFIDQDVILRNNISGELSSLITPTAFYKHQNHQLFSPSTSIRSRQQLAIVTSLLSLSFGICILLSVNNLSALNSANIFNSVEAIRPTTTHINGKI